MLFLLFLVATSGVTVQRSAASSGEQCTAAKISKVKFSYNSFRSETGQVISQVVLDHAGGPLSSNETSPWSLDVEQTTTTTCKGDKTINVVANITQAPPAVPLRKIIPGDYALFPGVGHYKIHPQGASWSSARQTCADEGAHLVIINSEDEVNIMKEFFKNPDLKGDRKDALWVGVYETGANGNYITIFGKALSLTGFVRWAGGHPNLTGPNECIWFHQGTLGLVDMGCASSFPFVCEIDL